MKAFREQWPKQETAVGALKFCFTPWNNLFIFYFLIAHALPRVVATAFVLGSQPSSLWWSVLEQALKIFLYLHLRIFILLSS